MNSCEIALSVNAIAIAIAKDKTPEELRFLAAIFFQLGSTLVTLSETPPC